MIQSAPDELRETGDQALEYRDARRLFQDEAAARLSDVFPVWFERLDCVRLARAIVILFVERVGMTNEEIQRTIELILEHQARFAARMEEDKSRAARLEESLMRLDEALVTLVEIARITDERQDDTDAHVDLSDGRLSRLEDAFATLVELSRIADERQNETDARVDTCDGRLSKLEDAFVTLVELSKIADERLDKAVQRNDKIEQRVDKFDEKMTALAEAQLHSELRTARLEDAFVRLCDIAGIIAQRQDKPDETH